MQKKKNVQHSIMISTIKQAHIRGQYDKYLAQVRDGAAKILKVIFFVNITFHNTTVKLTSRCVVQFLNYSYLKKVTCVILQLQKNCRCKSANRKEFWRRFITVYETWIHHSTPRTHRRIHRDPRTVQTVGFPRKICAKEG